jgi:hypothetical protein
MSATRGTSAELNVATGSTIDLSVAAANAGSAQRGQFSGTLHLRAPQNAAFNDVLVSPINGSIIDASSILVEGYRLYDLTASGGTITIRDPDQHPHELPSVHGGRRYHYRELHCDDQPAARQQRRAGVRVGAGSRRGDREPNRRTRAGHHHLRRHERLESGHLPLRCQKCSRCADPARRWQSRILQHAQRWLHRRHHGQCIVERMWMAR